jgi:glutathione S-transferase
MLTLYHGRTSVCAIKARIALAEKGLEWTGKLAPDPWPRVQELLKTA